MVPDAVGAEASFEQIDNATMHELARLDLEKIVSQREQTKTRIENRFDS